MRIKDNLTNRLNTMIMLIQFIARTNILPLLNIIFLEYSLNYSLVLSTHNHKYSYKCIFWIYNVFTHVPLLR